MSRIPRILNPLNPRHPWLFQSLTLPRLVFFEEHPIQAFPPGQHLDAVDHSGVFGGAEDGGASLWNVRGQIQEFADLAGIG